MTTAAATAENFATLPQEWETWVVESLLAGLPVASVAATVADTAGFSTPIARQLVAQLGSSAAFDAARATRQRLAKLESHLEALETMRRSSPTSSEVARRRNVTGHQFFENYYARNVPLLIEDFAVSWPAFRKWDPAFLRREFGHISVQIMDGREADPRYEENFNHHRADILLRDYLDTMISGRQSNDSYLVANNELLKRPEFAPLLADLAPNPDILDVNGLAFGSYLWLGSAGTVTPLHHDVENVLFVQLHGTKSFRLVSPYQSHRVYNNVSVYSDVDAQNPDPDVHGRFLGVAQLQTLVRPGEALFIPVGWWHHVESLEPSISVSFIDFLHPNDFEWSFPHLRVAHGPGGSHD
jgi:hypothetical protein